MPVLRPALLSCLLLLAAAHADGPPAGQLLDVRGVVQVKRGSQPPARAGMLFALQAGDLVFVAKGASTQVLVYRGGRRYILASHSSARIEEGALKGISGAPLRPRPSIAMPPPPPGGPHRRLMGLIVRDAGLDRGPIIHLKPRGGVRELPVTLTWETHEPVSGLTLTIRSEEGEVLHTAKIPGGECSYHVPGGVLQPGEYCDWSLAAAGEDGANKNLPPVPLRVLLPSERDALDRLEAAVQREQTTDPGDPSLMLALAQAYARYLFADDAVRFYDRVLHLRPGDPAVKAARDRLLKGEGTPAPPRARSPVHRP